MKKNLIILLLIPFLIALIGIATVDTTFNLIAPDITSIDWEYKEVETFQIIGSARYELKAKGVVDKKYESSPGNQLVWKVENVDTTNEEELARIEYVGLQVYLVALKPGNVRITCSNKKGNIFRTMTGLIYDERAVAITSRIPSSQNNIDPTIYYGEFDFNEDKTQKVKASFNVDITIVPETQKQYARVKSTSSNIKFTPSDGKIEILSEGDAFIRMGFDQEESKDDTIFEFKVVDNGVNVYDYEDLLKCSNKSTEGEIIVLRKNFESIENAYVAAGDTYLMEDNEYVTKNNNTTIFGTYLGKKNKYSFKDEVAYIDTTFNTEYIAQWNEFVKTNNRYKELSTKFIAGLHIKKDIYGNGYAINMHNLTYPYSSSRVKDEATGEYVYVPKLNDDNLYRGPLPFYTLGDPHGTPLVTAYGQDNVGMYVDGDNILVNDVQLRNCDFGNNLANLEYVGTTIETHGKNINVKNSRFGNGKNVLRSFSSDVNVDNCMFSNSRNFLITTGSNETLKVEGDKVVTFSLADGTTSTSTIAEFLAKNGGGDNLITSYLAGTFNDEAMMRSSLDVLSDALSRQEEVEGIYKGNLNINDSIFYQSGIASIALETLFNGPYLYSNVPSLIGMLFGYLTDEQTNLPLIPLEASNVGGTSYPVKVNITGKTAFYDYKDINTIDISGLIDENISKIAESLGKLMNIEVPEVSIDDIFPIKELLITAARTNGCIYPVIEDDKKVEYINIPIAYYGGGFNLSKVNHSESIATSEFGPEMPIDLLDKYLKLPGLSGDLDLNNLMDIARPIMLKAVTIVTGTEPFKFTCIKGNGYKFNETPDVQILIQNAKEALQTA